jgi:hypothetical protein
MDELKKHLNRLKKNLKYSDVFYEFPFDSNKVLYMIESSDVDKLDSIAYRLIKFQDSLGRTIELWFSLKEENTDMLTMLDLINLAEKKGFSIDIEFWRKLRSIRNKITHGYIESYDEIADALNLLYKFLPRFEKILKELEERS